MSDTETTPVPEETTDQTLVEETEKLSVSEPPAEDKPAPEEEEEEEDAPVEKKIVEDLREHINIIFIGHVDAGKSTIAGHVLYLSGMVDERTIQKYEREAKDKKHGTWFLAFIMDTNEEERAKGKTVEVGRAHFATEKRRFTVLDAPGHKNYVPNMIGGAAQADVGILVISARQKEFEAGFEGQGQTREHTTLVKTLGVKKLVIVVNKMDEQSVNWSQDRYNHIVKQFTPFLKSVGYNPKTDVQWVPVSGYTGANIKEKVDPAVCPWYKGESLLTVLDEMDSITRNSDGPIRFPVLDRYKEKGVTSILGKLESGTLTVGDKVTMMPNKMTSEIMFLEMDEIGSVDRCQSGEIVTIGLRDINLSDISQGFVLCPTGEELPGVSSFTAQLAVLELLPTKPILSAGYTAVIHVHTCTEDICIEKLVSVLDKKTKKPSKRPPAFCRKGDIVTVEISTARPICVELFKNIQQLGRFTLRDEGTTVAIGKIIALGK